MGDAVEFHGEQFRLADRIALMALMRFAKVAQTGADTDDMAGLVAMYDLLEQCIHPEDWPRFEVLATRERDQAEGLLVVIQQAISAMGERPTAPPSDSSAGRPSISGSSTGGSSSLGVHLLEQPGNAHLAYAARQRELYAV